MQIFTTIPVEPARAGEVDTSVPLPRSPDNGHVRFQCRFTSYSSGRFARTAYLPFPFLPATLRPRVAPASASAVAAPGLHCARGSDVTFLFLAAHATKQRHARYRTREDQVDGGSIYRRLSPRECPAHGFRLVSVAPFRGDPGR